MSGERHWDLYRDGLTQGLLGTWLTCRERAYLAFVLGLERPSTSVPLFVGSLVHGVLERVYAGDTRPVSEIVDEVDSEMQRPGFGDTFEGTAGLVTSMLEAYRNYWKRDDRRHHWLSVEHRFDVPFTLPSGRPTRLRGMIDGVFIANKKVWLLETKTASRVDERTLFDRLPFDLQVCFYMHAAECILGRRPHGVLYNVLRKPQLRQGAHENDRAFALRVQADLNARPDFYFRRYEVRVTGDEFRAWREEFEFQLEEFEAWHAGCGHYRNPTACDGKYGACVYLPICSRNETLGFARKQKIFNELED